MNLPRNLYWILIGIATLILILGFFTTFWIFFISSAIFYSAFFVARKERIDNEKRNSRSVSHE